MYKRQRADSLVPVMAGNIPQPIYPLVARISGEQEELSDAIAGRDMTGIINAFANDPLLTCSLSDARKLFREMVGNTAGCLKSYDLGGWEND